MERNAPIQIPEGKGLKDSLYKKKRQTIAHEVVSNVLVGAEEAEAKLEQLLTRKRALLGE